MCNIDLRLPIYCTSLAGSVNHNSVAKAFGYNSKHTVVTLEEALNKNYSGFKVTEYQYSLLVELW